jgi:hypothetical protein
MLLGHVNKKLTVYQDIYYKQPTHLGLIQRPIFKASKRRLHREQYDLTSLLLPSVPFPAPSISVTSFTGSSFCDTQYHKFFETAIHQYQPKQPPKPSRMYLFSGKNQGRPEPPLQFGLGPLRLRFRQELSLRHALQHPKSGEEGNIVPQFLCRHRINNLLGVPSDHIFSKDF